MDEFAQFLIRHCSPTLAGVKTGSLFNYPTDNIKEPEAFISLWNKELEEKGIQLRILRESEKKVLIYVYRERCLGNILQEEKAGHILKKYGYDGMNTEECIQHLSLRCKNSSCFPHEIGLFLGYPIHDVEGFIEHGGKNCRMCGCWKVYCEEESARRTFALYEKCSRIYSRLFYQGKSIGQLTVCL
ncbi:DUF3793 family protein [Lactonifactor longoviformis]|uniref:DUF3793 family protein n=1 Tax=Lactonifactor longoviformis TaxID=341220 RepID=UPI0036F33D00